MADTENSVSVYIGYGEESVVHARLELRSGTLAIWPRQCPEPTSCQCASAARISDEKTQLPSEAPSWITVPGIAYLNLDERDRLLCPVRQLKFYLRDSAAIRRDRKRLFVHWDPNIRDITKAHFSKWIVEVFKYAYIRRDIPLPDHVIAHELRALSASWAYNAHVALEDACSWSSPGVFQNNYLRDMSLCSEGMFSLGPVVVAQQVTGAR